MLSGLANKMLRVSMLKKFLVRVAINARTKSLKSAIEYAYDIHKRTGQKCLIFYVSGEFRVFTKQEIKERWRRGYFRKSTIQEIENKAEFVTK